MTFAWMHGMQDAEFVTSSRSKITSLAGAIAGRVRITAVVISVSIYMKE